MQKKPFFVCGKGKFETIGGLEWKRRGEKRESDRDRDRDRETCGLNLPGS